MSDQLQDTITPPHGLTVMKLGHGGFVACDCGWRIEVNISSATYQYKGWRNALDGYRRHLPWTEQP